MNKRQGYVNVAALMATVALICGGIYLGVGAVKKKPEVRTPPAAVPKWIGTWSASPVDAASVTSAVGSPTGRGGRSVRNVVHTSIGGTAARVTFSNLYGTEPLRISGASLAVRAGAGPGAVAGSLRRITFGGAYEVTVDPGGRMISDPVVLRIPYDDDLLISVHTPAPGGPVTTHPSAAQTSYLADGDAAQDETGAAYAALTSSWHHITAVDVLTSQARGAIVAIGDSITDGVSSTPGSNQRWPDVLADRLGGRYGVLNQGVSGNRLLEYGRGPSTLERFDRDVLARAGARTVIVAIGINDVLRAPHAPTADNVTAGLTELADRAHARGWRVIGSTLAPCGGYPRCTAGAEAERLKINRAIRSGDIFDAVVDFDAALRDPYAPGRLKPVYDSGDHLHPSDAGFVRMGQAVDVGAL
ncbi:SGNH/GDSL hydrolase family protein [Streptomyces peucetius]|uniref:SGNH/GDSL hydrolase family protein n=1 Tax=Streptomyces peucetius TaxID=1950 RepID=A0ABY6I982_STRPE|nr:SGNH/GDSL hydrolase family protein [Streptomyces peucetius]UYQ62320.1 SGNH/GDSL hydrolase family protein [Streptomyces peucetius]